MAIRGLRSALFASSGLVFIAGAPALTQEQGCTQRLDQIEKQLAEAPMDRQRQQDIRQVVKGARTLADTGDQDGCMRVVAELHGLNNLVQEQGTAQAGQPDQHQPAQQGHGQARHAASAEEQPQGQSDELVKTGQQVQVEAPHAQGDATAEIRVQQPQPQVTVTQPQPQITVHVPPPRVTIRMPQPEVVVRMPQPQVDIQMAEPEVQVNTPRPEVRVIMPEPEVQVEAVQPHVQVQEAQPQVRFQESPQQANVKLQMAEPEVHIEQAQGQAKVTVEQQKPQINVQRAGGQSQQLAGRAEPAAASHGQALHQAERAVRQALQALAQNDVVGARAALDQADSSMRDAGPQAPAEKRAPLQQIEQRVSDARQALEREDVDAARQALEEAREPLQLISEAGGEPALAQAGEPVKQRQAQPGEQSEPPVPLTEPAHQQAAPAPPVESRATREQPAPPAEQRRARPVQPETQLAAPREQAPTEHNPLAAMAASDVIGATVTNQEGDNVAEIVDLVKPQDSDEIYAVLSVGGLLGVGDKKVVVPLKALQVGQDGEVVLANGSKDQLEQMAEYDETRYQSTAAGNASQQQ